MTNSYLNPYKLIGDKARLTEQTVRNAMARRSVSLYTARCIAKAMRIDINAFVYAGKPKLPIDENPYRHMATATGLSEQTVRNAMARKKIVVKTARRIADYLDIPIEGFAIKRDNRGKNRKCRTKTSLPKNGPKKTESNQATESPSPMLKGQAIPVT